MDGWMDGRTDALCTLLGEGGNDVVNLSPLVDLVDWF